MDTAKCVKLALRVLNKTMESLSADSIDLFSRESRRTRTRDARWESLFNRVDVLETEGQRGSHPFCGLGQFSTSRIF